MNKEEVKKCIGWVDKRVGLSDEQKEYLEFAFINVEDKAPQEGVTDEEIGIIEDLIFEDINQEAYWTAVGKAKDLIKKLKLTKQNPVKDERESLHEFTYLDLKEHIEGYYDCSVVKEKH